MALIHVPRPPKRARDPNRPISSLLKMQIEHLLAVERRLPVRYHSGIYVNAIETEGEAAEYIRQVTEAVHRAHQEAQRSMLTKASRHRRSRTIVAAATPARRKRSSTAKKRKKTTKGAAKK